MLGVSDRTFRRWRDRLKDEGPAGLKDRRLLPSGKRAAQAEIERMLGLYRDTYSDFTVKHFHEQLVKRHGYKLGYTVTKVWLQRSGLVSRAKSRSAHRKKRPRRPMIGMMLHQDGSRYAWVPGDRRAYDLIVTLDDATGEIYSAFIVEEEGTASTFRGLLETIERKGLFCSLYTDRGSHYFHTPQAGGKVSRSQLTQVGRALRQLGIEHIAAYSPQARGRSERAFGTLQDRLPKELRLAGISSVEGANDFLRNVYIDDYNRRFAVQAEQDGSAFVADSDGAAGDILCVQEERRVGNDNTLRWKALSLQLPESRLRPSFVRTQVRVREYPNGSLSVFWGPHRLGDYAPDGSLITQGTALAA